MEKMINTIFIKVKKLKIFFNIFYFDSANNCPDLTILYYKVLDLFMKLFQKIEAKQI